MAKLVTDALLKKNIEDILTELVNSTYQWESYSDEEIGNLVELDPTQVAELSAVISDTVVAKNKVFSSFHTKELLQENIIEANKYADDLVANLSNIKLDIVDALPDSSTVNKSTIYILKDSTGGTNNTLNVWSDTTSAFVEVGKLNVNMDNYYTKSEVDAELIKKANADEVLKPDAIVANLTTTNGSTTLSTAGLKTELDKKVDKTNIVTTLDDTVTDGQVASALLIKTKLGEKADKSYVDDNFATIDKVVEFPPKKKVPTWSKQAYLDIFVNAKDGVSFQILNKDGDEGHSLIINKIGVYGSMLVFGYGMNTIQLISVVENEIRYAKEFVGTDF